MPNSTVTLVEQRAGAVWVHVLAETLEEESLAAVQADTSDAGSQSPESAVFLDLAKVAFLPSLSLGGLIQLSRNFKTRGQRLVLTGLQPYVRQMMALTRLDRLFEIQDEASK